MTGTPPSEILQNMNLEYIEEIGTSHLQRFQNIMRLCESFLMHDQIWHANTTPQNCAHSSPFDMFALHIQHYRSHGQLLNQQRHQSSRLESLGEGGKSWISVKLFMFHRAWCWHQASFLPQRMHLYDMIQSKPTDNTTRPNMYKGPITSSQWISADHAKTTDNIASAET